MKTSIALQLLLGASSVAALPSLEERQFSGYQPVTGFCPSESLVRPASNGIGSGEAAYVAARKPKADAALASWLKKTNPAFVTTKLPTLALATGGGGFRAFLTGAGIHQAFDASDSRLSTSGLYQALTYESGLSSSSWLLGSILTSNWATVSNLAASLWIPALVSGSTTLDPFQSSELSYDFAAKQMTGFAVTFVDLLGRITGLKLFPGPDGAVTSTWSGLTTLSNFTSYNVPFPMVTARGLDTNPIKCVPLALENSTQYEFTPYEYGSWDAGVAAFAQTKYMGTTLANGQPSSFFGGCVTRFDNTGYIVGSSTNIFNELCGPTTADQDPNNVIASFFNGFASLVTAPSTLALNAPFPNPFYRYAPSTLINNYPQLSVLDGGEGHQIVPIWPMLFRNVDVLFASDTSEDTVDNFPNGTQLNFVYQQSRAKGNTRFPAVPSVSTFVTKGLNKRPVFFGCNTPSTLTVIYLPMVNYTFPANQPTSRQQWAASDTVGMIANGNAVATHNNDTNWGTCVGCAIMKKTKTALPAKCSACFTQYCYN